MDLMVIDVSGLPDNYSRDSMIDKLTMHFLRRSNNGGDVLTVIYPTSIKGQAYVVFELPEVSGVLQHTHVLEVDGQFYPVDVKRGYHPELDMPVEALLNVNMFSRQREIKHLLKEYDFIVSETRSGELHLQGSFLKLKVIRPKLMQILAQETQRATSSPYTNSYSNGSVSKSGSSDHESISNSTLMHRHINGNSRHTRVKSPSTEATSGSPESQKHLPLSWTDSPQDGGYSTQDFSSSATQAYKYSKTSSRQWDFPLPRHREISFPVEPDVFRYTMCFKKDLIKKIQLDHGVVIKHDEDPTVFTVKLLGGGCEEAAKELSFLMQDITSSLRTQEINLNKLDKKQNTQISQQAETFQQVYKVLITQEDDIIKVVGTSKDSYEAKQNLLEQKVDTPLASLLPKNSRLRRSTSLPRQTTKSRIEDLDVRQSPDTESAAASGYSASRYQTKSKSQQPLQQERGRQPTKSTTQCSRVQTASESRYKRREDKAPPPSDEQDLSLSSGAKTSKKGQAPKMLFSLLPVNVSFPKLHRKKQQISHV